MAFDGTGCGDNLGLDLTGSNPSAATLIKARNDRTTVFNKKTRSHEIAKENRDNHSMLLRWILEQIPLIEAELNESKVAGGHRLPSRRDSELASKGWTS
jgi:hypothetical protein